MKSESTFTAIVAKDKNGSYTGFIEEVPGAISQGKTVAETIENLQDALKMMLDYYKSETKKTLRNAHVKIESRQKLVLT